MANTQERVLQARIRLIDNFSRPIQQVSRSTQRFQQQARRVAPLVLRARDMATRVLSTVISKARSFGAGVYSAVVKVKDMASSALGSITSKLSALAGGVTIGVALKTGVDGLIAEETQRITIDRVLQNSGVKKDKSGAITDEYYKYLEDFANKTPFETSSLTDWGTKSMMINKGDLKKSKKMTEQMANVKAFVGDMRTEYEVGQAFFSASQGEMATLNSMLGTSYKTISQAMKGIDKNQAGLVDSMSTTVGGLWSTVTGKLKVGSKKFVQVFQEPLTESLNGIIGIIDNLSPKVVEFGVKALEGFNKFRQSDEARAMMEIFGTVVETVWGMIKTVIEAVTPTVEKIMKFMAEHSDVIKGAIEGLGGAWSGLCQILGPMLSVAWSILEPLLLGFLSTIEALGSWIKDVGDWWTDMCNKIKNNPIVAKVSTWWDGAGSKEYVDNSPKSQKKNAFGSGRISRNNELHMLHQGEKVLTKNEANQLDRNGSTNTGITVNMNGITVREEADISKIAKEFVRELKIAKFSYVGG